jgi:ATP-binding cassette subfamily F protein 3
MSILSAEQLGKYYGAQDVFSDLEFSVARGDKIGLVGPNGVGKTTLLRIILGLEEPSTGNVQRARGVRMGYLPQKSLFPSDQTLYAEMLSVFVELSQQHQALLSLADEMAVASDPAELMERYAVLEHRFELAGGYEYENRIRRVLAGLGFGADMDDWPIAMLSGGQVTRALLAKLLLQDPELLILDEPTNYLDLQALEWFEAYLQEWSGSVLVVSHDRYFLDHVVSRIWDLNHGRLELYRGNYSSYVVQRQARRERQWLDYEEQQAQIAKTEDFIRRYKAGQRSKQARGRETRLERLERVGPPPTEQKIHLRISTSLRSGDNVLMSDGALIGYPGKPDVAPAIDSDEENPFNLFYTGEFLVQRGQRVALLGPNGSGKTSFLRTVLGQIEPLAGHIGLGASLRVGYLPQKQDWLDPEKTILEQLLDMSDLDIPAARHLLARFLFTGDDIYKSISALSGGELSRVALAILTIRGANFLLLDEPTTHLDVDSQEILQDVLHHFNGTIILVSHDRYLVDALATHVWVIDQHRMRQFEGNYSVYIAQLERERLERVEEARGASVSESEVRRRQDRERQRVERKRASEVESLEAQIAELEKQVKSVTHLLELASVRQDVGRVQALGEEYQRLEARLALRLAEWEERVSVDDPESA